MGSRVPQRGVVRFSGGSGAQKGYFGTFGFRVVCESCGINSIFRLVVRLLVVFVSASRVTFVGIGLSMNS